MPRKTRTDGPPMMFDGRIFWYLQWFDPAEDLCCAPDCRKPIPEDDIPIILFAGRGAACRQSRLHVGCAMRLRFFGPEAEH